MLENCWTAAAATVGYDAYYCCHPFFGRYGNPECWDDTYTPSHCCNESIWEKEQRYHFHMQVQFQYTLRCSDANFDDPTSAEYWYSDVGTGEWQTGIHQELIFWFMSLRSLAYPETSPGGRVSEIAKKLAPRLDPMQPLDPRLRRIATRSLGRNPRSIRVLDVGSGPLSVAGRSWPGVEVEVIPTDALGCEYSAMLSDLGIADVPLPRRILAEGLTAALGLNRFHVAFCRNALDHCADPLAAIAQMLRAVAPGGGVLLSQVRNEGQRENYTGFHKFNLDVQRGRFVVWWPLRGDALPQTVDVEARMVAEGLVRRGSTEVSNFTFPEDEEDEEWFDVVLWRRRT